jgi:hypothetical protein
MEKGRCELKDFLIREEKFQQSTTKQGLFQLTQSVLSEDP